MSRVSLHDLEPPEPTRSEAVATAHLPTIIQQVDYTGDDTLQIYVPGAVPPNLSRVRHRAADKPLPKGATTCALIDLGMQELRGSSVVRSYERLGRIILDRDDISADALEYLFEHATSNPFRVRTMGPMRRLQVRCSEHFATEVGDLGEALGLSTSMIACVCLMSGLASHEATHPGHRSMLGEAVGDLLDTVARRIEQAESFLKGTSGRVL